MKKIFICGCGHSGTSLLMAILLSHPRVGGELYETNCFIKGKENINLYESLVLESLKLGKDFFVEKTPNHILNIEFIKKHIPDSFFLLCIKNPLDVVASMKKRYGDIRIGIDRYRKSNIELCKSFDANIMAIVKYEDMVSNPSQSVEEICSFIGLDYRPEMLNFYQNKRNFFNVKECIKPNNSNTGSNLNLLRNWQVHQPIQNMCGKYKNILSAAEEKEIRSKLRYTASKIGYLL